MKKIIAVLLWIQRPKNINERIPYDELVKKRDKEIWLQPKKIKIKIPAERASQLL